MNRGLFGHIPGAGSVGHSRAALDRLGAAGGGPDGRRQLDDGAPSPAGLEGRGHADRLLGHGARGPLGQGLRDLAGSTTSASSSRPGRQLASLRTRSVSGRNTGDVDFLYVQGALFKRHLVLTVGRQLISGGAARVLQLDGVNATVLIGKGFGVSGYAGAPTCRASATGREVRLRGPGLLEADLRQRDRASPIWRSSATGTSPGRTWAWMAGGSSSTTCPSRPPGILSLGEGRLSDAAAGVRWFVIPTLELFAKAEITSPDLYLPADLHLQRLLQHQPRRPRGWGVLAGAAASRALRRVPAAVGGRRQRRRGRAAGHLQAGAEVHRRGEREAALHPVRTVGPSSGPGWSAQ